MAKEVDGAGREAQSREVTDPRFASLAELAARIQRDASGTLAWAWDDYTGAALATLPSAAAEPMLALLQGAFAEHYAADSLPEALAPLAGASGGLRAGQRLFATAGEGGAWLVGAWWPWGNGQTISLRIRLVDASVTPAAVHEQPLRSWFDI